MLSSRLLDQSPWIGGIVVTNSIWTMISYVHVHRCLIWAVDFTPSHIFCFIRLFFGHTGICWMHPGKLPYVYSTIHRLLSFILSSNVAEDPLTRSLRINIRYELIYYSRSSSCLKAAWKTDQIQHSRFYIVHSMWEMHLCQSDEEPLAMFAQSTSKSNKIANLFFET